MATIEDEPIDPQEYERVRSENARLRREHQRLHREYQRLTADYKTYKVKLDEATVATIEQQAQTSVQQAEQSIMRQPLITNLPRVMMPPRPKGTFGHKRKRTENDEEELLKRQEVAEAKAVAAKQAKEAAVSAELAPLGPEQLLDRLCLLAPSKKRPEIPATAEESDGAFSISTEVDGETLKATGASSDEAKVALYTQALVKLTGASDLEGARSHIKTLKLNKMKKQ
eukprot:Hpha_TRINITY_DN9588_c0_g2::TRINITY_DN9588_c0_g2_i1::g.114758::m.114758